MGYRTYIGFLPKREYNKIKSLTYDELKAKFPEHGEGDDWYMGSWELAPKLYEFGKYTDFDPPKGSFLPFFKNKELKKRYVEEEFMVVTKQFLAYIIESYALKIQYYYENMMQSFSQDAEYLDKLDHEYDSDYNRNYILDITEATTEQKKALYKCYEHVKSMSFEWRKGRRNYNLDEGSELTHSWKFEYGIYELIKIYKTFDWGKNVMVYYGY